MSDLDQLRPAFEDLRIAVLPEVRPPGVAAARRTLRRRRRRRAVAGASAAATLALGLAGLVVWQTKPAPSPVEPPADSPAASSSGGLSPSPGTGGGVPVPHPAASATPQPTGHAAAPGTSQSPAGTCKTEGVVDLVNRDQDNWVSVEARVDGRFSGQLCPGERVRVFWASYTMDGSGVLHLYRSAVYYVDEDHPDLRFHVDVPRTCEAAFYVVYGKAPIIDPLRDYDRSYNQSRDPYPNRKLDWRIYDPCPIGGPPTPPPG